MVLESLLKPRLARRHPVIMLIDAFILCAVAMAVSLQTFPQYASVLSVAMITVGIVPLLYSIFSKEEKEEAKHPGTAISFLERHFDIIMIYSWFFIGLIIAFTFLYWYLPDAQRALAFKEQDSVWGQISTLRPNISQANAAGPACKSPEMFTLAVNCIFANNANVLFWALLFSLVYGVGSIFLIAWNASVISVVIGKELLATDITRAAMRAIGLLPHGIPEVAAYFIGAIAGGILSVGLTRKNLHKKEFETCVKDAIVLVVTAYIILFVAAIMEAYLILNA